MKIISKLRNWIRNPLIFLESYYHSNFPNQDFIFLIGNILGICGLLHGLIMAQTQLLMSYPSLINQKDIIRNIGETNLTASVPSVATLLYPMMFNDLSTNIQEYCIHSYAVYFVGLAVGSVCSYPFCDVSGRIFANLLFTVFTWFMLLWNTITFDVSTCFTAKFCLGIGLGAMMNISGILLTEVS